MPTHVKSPNERHVRVRLDPGGMQDVLLPRMAEWQVGKSSAPGPPPIRRHMCVSWQNNTAPTHAHQFRLCLPPPGPGENLSGNYFLCGVPVNEGA